MIFKKANVINIDANTMRAVSALATAVLSPGKDPSKASLRSSKARRYIEINLKSPTTLSVADFFGVSYDLISKLEESDRISMSDSIDLQKLFSSLNSKSQQDYLGILNQVLSELISTPGLESSAISNYQKIQDLIKLELEKFEQPKSAIITETTEELPVIPDQTLTPESSQVAENSSEKALESIRQQESDLLLDKWYVSSADRPVFFKKDVPIYGPFENKYQATLFSSLIHTPRFPDDGAVAKGSYVADKKVNLMQAISSPYSGVPVRNNDYVSSIKQESDNTVEIGLSGEVFDSLADYISKLPGSTPEDRFGHANIISWHKDRNFSDFIREFRRLQYTQESSNNEVEQLSGVIPTTKGDGGAITPPEVEKSEKKKSTPAASTPAAQKTISKEAPTKIDVEDAEEISQIITASLSATQMDGISIISQDGLLVNDQISTYIEQLRLSSRELSNITPDTVKNSYVATLSHVNEFFKKIIVKDSEIRSSLISYRQANPLSVAGITNDWEFLNLYSIFSRISKDREIVNNISQLISKMVSVKSLYRTSPTIEDIISSELKKRRDRGLQTDSDIVTAQISDYVERITKEITLKETIEKIDTICTSRILSVNVDNIVDEITNSVKIRTIIGQAVSNYLRDNAYITNEQVIETYKCGICDQPFSIPSEYKKFMSPDLSSANKLQVYSFFRESDGSLITEEEIISGGPYTISSEIKNSLTKRRDISSSQSSPTVMRRPGTPGAAATMTTRKVEASYSWEAINAMIAGNSVSDQIDGLIIRNDVLRILGGSPIQGSSLFSNKVMCASEQLANLSINTEISKSALEYLEKNQNFKCNGSVRPSAVGIPDNIRSYQSSAYKSPFGNVLGISNVDSYNNSGFKFSRQHAYCPCQIDQSNDVVRQYNLSDAVKKNYYKFIAVPKISPSDAAKVAESLKIDLSKIYSPPTDASGGYSTNQGLGYVVCGRKVSLSMFDRDPTSQNYIGKFFESALNTGGPSLLRRKIEALISFGIEINDIKPHIESVVQESDISKTSKVSLIKNLLKISKLSIAQDLSRSELIRDLGLICEYGHKFTINQSWEFSRTHSAVPTFTYKSSISPTKVMNIINNPDDIIKSLTDVGIYSVSDSEESLRSAGYRSVEEVISNINPNAEFEFFALMSENKVYSKHSDGSIFIIGKPKYGELKNNPWEVGSLSRSYFNKKRLIAYASGHVSSTQVSEEGESLQLAGDDPRADEEDDQPDFSPNQLESMADDSQFESQEYEEADFISRDLGLFEIFPQLDADKSMAISQHGELIELQESDKIKSTSSKFINGVISTMEMARTCVKLAADAQMDVFSTARVSLDTSPSIKQDIISVLGDLSQKIKINPDLYTDEFFTKYDIDGILSGTVYKEFFFTFGSIARYYDGVTIPSLAGRRAGDIKNDLSSEITKSLNNNMSIMLRKYVPTSFNFSDISSEIERLSSLLIKPFLPIFNSVTAMNKITEKVVSDYTGRAIIISHSINAIEKMVRLFNSYFFNEGSNLYIGTYGQGEASGLILLKDLLSYRQVEGVQVPALFLMTDEEFSQAAIELKNSLLLMYDKEVLFSSYMSFKRISIKKVDSKNEGEYNNQLKELKRQRATVFYRYNRIFEAADESLKSVSINAPSYILDESRLTRSSQILDASLIKMASIRSNVGTEGLIEEIKANREAFGENIFQQNSVGYAKLILDPSNVALANIAPTNFIIEKSILDNNYIDSARYMGDLDPIAPISLEGTYLYRLKELKVGEVKYFFAIVPAIPDFVKGKSSNKIDLIDYLKFDSTRLIRANNPQILNFAKNYLKSNTVDYSRLILVESSLLLMTSAASVKEEEIANIFGEISDSSLRIRKVDDYPKFWPPPDNLFFSVREYCRPKEQTGDYAPIPKTPSFQKESLIDSVDSRLNDIIARDRFEENLEEFPLSITPRTMAVSSSHGLLIPLPPGGLDAKKAPEASNFISHDKRKTRSDSLYISESSLKIRDQDQNILDISWAFRMLDPQVEITSGETGETDIRHKLVQSGVVQKLSYISAKMNEIHSWLYDKTPVMINAIISSNIENPDSTKRSCNVFLNTFFSSLNPIIRMNSDLDSEVKIAALVALDGNIYARYVMDNIPNLSQDFFNKIQELISYYNYSQRLNKIYRDLKPAIGFSGAFDVTNKNKTLAPTLYLLDPYSLWKMITNPTMTTTFGGPIEPDKIESYKNFIISTFSMNVLSSQMSVVCGFDPGQFKPEDLFDIKSFVENYISKKGMDSSIKKFEKILGLVIDGGVVRTYSNGYPIGLGQGNNKELQDALSLASESTYYSGNIESSYIKYPYKVGNIFSSSNIEEDRQRNLDLQSGKTVHTSNDLLIFSRGQKLSDLRNLASELQRIFGRIYSLDKKKSSYKNQSISKRASTIYESLYMEWWDAYQNMMAKDK